jgi:hypothetical protein
MGDFPRETNVFLAALVGPRLEMVDSLAVVSRFLAWTDHAAPCAALRSAHELTVGTSDFMCLPS